jgi:membrane fusion protein, multidrug efflux system
MRFPFRASSLTLVLLLCASCAKNHPPTEPVPNILVGARVETIALSPVTDTYEAVGTIRSKTTSILSSRITGTVVAIHVREGDHVRTGQVLVEIDSRDARSSVLGAEAASREASEALEESARAIQAAESARSVAEANRSLASSTFNRYKSLLDKKSVSPQEFDEVQSRYRAASAESDRASALLGTLEARRNQTKARLEQAAAALDSARVSLSYAQIKSPMNGVITAKQVDVGATAAPGVPIVTVEDASSYRLEAAVEDSYIGRVRQGDAVGTVIDALGTDEIPGRISEVVPASDPASHSYVVKIDINVPRSEGGGASPLRSGLFGRARFKLADRQALLLPLAAIVHQGQLTGVYVMEPSGVAHLRLIKCGKAYRDSVEVLSGLNEGDRFVADGASRIDNSNSAERAEADPLARGGR